MGIEIVNGKPILVAHLIRTQSCGSFSSRIGKYWTASIASNDGK